MTNTLRICAVVVTFNRRAWLLECLDTLLAQTQALSGIVVVNNASSDDTQIQLDDYVAAHPEMTWHIAHNTLNTGGAGGFAQGMQTAHEADYDWVWVMDDDVLARPEALSGLMAFSDQAQFLHGRRTNPNGSVFFWQNTFLPWIGFSRPYPDSVFKTADIWFTNCACFEGALIHRSVFDAIGYADPRYFLAWDDTEFGYRASEFFKVAYVNALTLKRQRGHDNIDLGVRSLFHHPNHPQTRATRMGAHRQTHRVSQFYGGVDTQRNAARGVVQRVVFGCALIVAGLERWHCGQMGRIVLIASAPCRHHQRCLP
jgi:GT2 family glycosyltransferase